MADTDTDQAIAEVAAMASSETILIGTEAPFTGIVQQLAVVLDVDPVLEPGPPGEAAFIVGNSWLDISQADRLEGVPLGEDEPWYEGITFELSVLSVAEGKALDAAVEFYERIVAGTSWKVVLLGPDDRPARTRPALERA